ncbi:hypothetical protein DVH24_006211 [Malus domestica]|uniref:Uncharacterized protein n=1 Tax=Malus domestica TaxID=3750 RepID=A0A498KEY1_MALDO|nr:hypothetical protein DVH24_006211 [Malus domestica]
MIKKGDKLWGNLVSVTQHVASRVGLSGPVCTARKQASDVGLQQVVVKRQGCRRDLVAWRRCNGCDDGFLGLSSETIRWCCKFGYE